MTAALCGCGSGWCPIAPSLLSSVAAQHSSGGRTYGPCSKPALDAVCRIREGGREAGRERGREAGREGEGREGGREGGGRKRGREGGRE